MEETVQPRQKVTCPLMMNCAASATRASYVKSLALSWGVVIFSTPIALLSSSSTSGRRCVSRLLLWIVLAASNQLRQTMSTRSLRRWKSLQYYALIFRWKLWRSWGPSILIRTHVLLQRVIITSGIQWRSLRPRSASTCVVSATNPTSEALSTVRWSKGCKIRLVVRTSSVDLASWKRWAWDLTLAKMDMILNLSTGSVSTAAQLLFSTVEALNGIVIAVIMKLLQESLRLETAEAKTVLSKCHILQQAMTIKRARSHLAVAFAAAITSRNMMRRKQP